MRTLLLGKLADPHSPKSLGYRARQRRMERLLRRFPDFLQMEIVDLGGATAYWHRATIRPARVTVVSIDEWAIRDPAPWMATVQADACDPDRLEGAFDLVFSNSVIEHVGGPRHRRGFAETVHKLAPHHWVQTPYRYFPLEPHLIFPGFQFLPPASKVRIASHWPLSHIRGRADVDPVQYVMDHELLTITEMQALFPRSVILRERFGGIVKSLVATA